MPIEPSRWHLAVSMMSLMPSGISLFVEAASHVGRDPAARSWQTNAPSVEIRNSFFGKVKVCALCLRLSKGLPMSPQSQIPFETTANAPTIWSNPCLAAGIANRTFATKIASGSVEPAKQPKRCSRQNSQPTRHPLGGQPPKAQTARAANNLADASRPQR